jgi:hypothetical protein
MTKKRSIKYKIYLYALLLSGCQSADIRIESEPSGGQVFIREQMVGQTPFSLPKNNEYFENESRVTEAVIVLPNYEKQNLFLQKNISQTYKVVLKPYSPEFFQTQLFSQFHSQINEFSRELLSIQGFLYSKKFDEAEKKIIEFQKKYPNIAASYVLQSHIEFEKGQTDKAKAALGRAQTLDPSDPTVLRTLEKLKLGAER